MNTQSLCYGHSVVILLRKVLYDLSVAALFSSVLSNLHMKRISVARSPYQGSPIKIPFCLYLNNNLCQEGCLVFFHIIQCL